MSTFENPRLMHFPAQEDKIDEFYFFYCEISEEDLFLLSQRLDVIVIDLERYEEILRSKKWWKETEVVANYYFISRIEDEIVISLYIWNNRSWFRPLRKEITVFPLGVIYYRRYFDVIRNFLQKRMRERPDMYTLDTSKKFVLPHKESKETPLEFYGVNRYSRPYYSFY